jgi:tRNA G18 (ribose-2'-O)-methylase SpoU
LPSGFEKFLFNVLHGIWGKIPVICRLSMKKLKLSELGRMSEEEFRASEKFPVIAILENIRSFHNTGSIFRSADAFRIERLILSGYTPAPPHREIHKTALGAENSVNWNYEKDPLAEIQNLKNAGWKVCAIEHTDSSVPIGNFRLSPGEKYVLIFGNEVEGVSESVLGQCDHCIEIPQYGTKHSLNVSVAAGIIFYAFTSRLALANTLLT